MRIRNTTGIWTLVVWLILIPISAWASDGTQPLIDIPLSLDECLKIGFNNNIQLRIDEHNIEIARKGVKQARGSFMPTVGYQSDYTKSKSIPYTQDETYGEAAQINQKLFTGGALTSAYKKAKLDLETAKENKRQNEQTLTFQIKKTYYDLWLKQQNYTTALKSRENMGKHYQLVQRMYKIGKVNKLELYQAQVQWEEQKVTAVMANNEVADARLSLSSLIGIDKNSEFSAELNLSEFKPIDIAVNSFPSFLEEAYRSRPEMRKVTQSITGAEYGIEQAKAGLLPQLSLTGTFSKSGEEFLDGENYWSLKLSLTGMVFDGYATQARIEIAQERLRLYQTQQNSIREQIEVDLLKAIRSLKESKVLIESNRANITIAQETVRLTEIQFSNGKVTTNDVKTAQASLDQALNSYYGQVVNYLIALSNLDYVIGKDN